MFNQKIQIFDGSKDNFVSPKGFTILELLIVLGIIVAVFGLGLPGLHRIYAHNRLKSATHDLQGILYRTRLEAMKGGKAIVFRYEYGSSFFEILPKEFFDEREKNSTGLGAIAIGAELLEAEAFSSSNSPELLPAENSLQDLSVTESFSTQISQPEFQSDVYKRSLPSQIIFGFRQPLSNSIILNGNTSEMLTGSENRKKSNDNWSPPILFFPNGRTSQAILILQTTGRFHFEQQLTLRGLTGTAKMNE